MEKKSIIIAGGAGFVGSSLVAKFIELGYYPIVIDNLSTGRLWKFNAIDSDNYKLIIDNVDGIGLRTLLEIRTLTAKYQLDGIINLTCTGSSKEKCMDALKTLDTCYIGTRELLSIANQFKVKYLHVGSVAYGEVFVAPQPEGYNGIINPISIQAPHLEGNRIAETVISSFVTQTDLDARIAHIYNVYGPNMNPEDQRLIPYTIVNSLKNSESITVYRDGLSTRSFTYITDVIDGIIKLYNATRTQLQNELIPVYNIGSSESNTVLKVVQEIQEQIKTKMNIELKPLKIVKEADIEDSPLESMPDTKKAKKYLKYDANVLLSKGISSTIEYFIAAYQKMQQHK